MKRNTILTFLLTTILLTLSPAGAEPPFSFLNYTNLKKNDRIVIRGQKNKDLTGRGRITASRPGEFSLDCEIQNGSLKAKATLQLTYLGRKGGVERIRYRYKDDLSLTEDADAVVEADVWMSAQGILTFFLPGEKYFQMQKKSTGETLIVLLPGAAILSRP